MEDSNFNDHLVEITECLGYAVDVMFCTGLHLIIKESEAVCVDNCQVESLTLVENVFGYMVKDSQIVGDVHCSGNTESDDNVFLAGGNTYGTLTGSQCRS